MEKEDESSGDHAWQFETPCLRLDPKPFLEGFRATCRAQSEYMFANGGASNLDSLEGPCRRQPWSFRFGQRSCVAAREMLSGGTPQISGTSSASNLQAGDCSCSLKLAGRNRSSCEVHRDVMMGGARQVNVLRGEARQSTCPVDFYRLALRRASHEFHISREQRVAHALKTVLPGNLGGSQHVVQVADPSTSVGTGGHQLVPSWWEPQSSLKITKFWGNHGF